MFTWWSWETAQAAQASSSRAIQNVDRARRAANQLQSLQPRTLPLDSGQEITGLLDSARKSAEISDRSLRSESIRSQGTLGDTGILRQSAHVELASLSQAQAAKVVDALERSTLPIWIESADLTAADSGRWNLVLEIAWLENPVVDNKRR
jgi:hypothetical protein